MRQLYKEGKSGVTGIVGGPDWNITKAYGRNVLSEAEKIILDKAMNEVIDYLTRQEINVGKDVSVSGKKENNELIISVTRGKIIITGLNNSAGRNIENEVRDALKKVGVGPVMKFSVERWNNKRRNDEKHEESIADTGRQDDDKYYYQDPIPRGY